MKAEAEVCRFCGYEFPTAPIRQPELRRPINKMLKGILIAFGVLVALSFVSTVVSISRHPPTGNTTDAATGPDGSPSATPTSSSADKGKQLGVTTAIAAGQALHSAARNPDALVIEQGFASDDGKLVCVEYRAQNGFGGMNREFVAFDNGKPRDSAAYWNKHCRHGLNDVTSDVKLGTTMSR